MRTVARLVQVTALCALVALSAPAQTINWQIPPDAQALKSPLTPTADVLKKGKAVFASQCQKCHGPQGTGNGPDSDPLHPAADLTNGLRAAVNTDGVMFYKIWNGRKPMPAFKSDLTKDDIWAVVEYAKSLRVSPDAGQPERAEEQKH